MKKKIIFCVFILNLLAMLVIPNKIFAITITGGYTIDSYDIDMVVNEDNTFDITETITTYFYVAKHGIYRKIPLKNTVIRTDGTTSKNKAKITDISVNEDYTTSNENGYKVIKIGDANNTVTGKHTYTIKYKYDIGKDPLENADELYYNLIGDEWDTSISDISFKITMPKSFDSSSLGFSSGATGLTDSSNVYYNVEDNVITGFVIGSLEAEEALTVRVTLPEGYFTATGPDTDTYAKVVIITCIIFVLIAYELWAKYGKDEEVIETVEFYPPAGFNSAEVGFLYEGSVDDKSIISLLIYLADKGYLKIEEIEEKGLFTKSKGFRITKLKEYDGNNECEKIFFNGLFKAKKNYSITDFKKVKELMKEAKEQGKKLSYSEAVAISTEDSSASKQSVTKSDLYDNFYTTIDRIKTKMNTKENKAKILEPTASGKCKYLIMMIVAIFALITIKPVLEYEEPIYLLFALIFPGIGFTVLIGSLIGAIKMPKIFGLIWGGTFGGIPWAFMVLPILTQNVMYLIMYILGLICVALLILFAKIMPKRTDYGIEILGKIKGFKRFLETAEKSELENLVSQNPEYFYNVLPYTYALGVSDVWMKQFETIAMQAPDWYDGYSSFSMYEFSDFMNDTMKSAQDSMTSSPSSSSGGGSSGGGSGGGRRRLLVVYK